MSWNIQSDNENGKVKVKDGYSSDFGVNTTEFILTDKTDTTGHHHVVMDEDGNEIFNSWRNNH